MIANPRAARCIGALLICAAGATFAADPFYERLLRDGSDAYNRRDYEGAARLFRTACFGLLDEPELLADGLVRLGLAQAAAGDPPGFRETFRRLVEVEARFQAYSKASLAKDMRDTYERYVSANIPEATLKASPFFASLVPTREERLAQLAPRERRKELEKLVVSEPKELKWHLQLASLALTDGDSVVAREQADAALALSPGNKEALRLRGLALSRDKKWAQASADLKASEAAASDARVAEALLRCEVQLEQWQAAATLVALLPPDIRQAGAIPELSRRTDDALAEARSAAARPTVAPTPAKSPETKSTPRPTAAKATRVPTATATVKATARAATPTPTAAGSATPSPRPVTPTAVARPATPTPTATVRVASTAAPTPTATLPPAAISLTSPPEPFADEMARVRELAAQDKLLEAGVLARGVADAHPESAEAQHLAGEIAYRGAQWTDAVAYFRRGGDPGVAQPLRLFYFAVSLYESGDRDAAAATLKRCLARIKNTEYVEQYRRKILGP